jgi:nicotinate-nucleotide pyrophosphorylase (carboxylating)
MNVKLTQTIKSDVERALAEDVGDGDLTSNLIPKGTQINAQVSVRTSCTICGIDWFNEVFSQIDKSLKITWFAKDGDQINKNTVICELSGSARSLFTGERTALNFLQTLSSIASKTRAFVDTIKDTNAKILDTRKTIPGLRIASKYAVKMGGGTNHRIGLFDAILIKENHIAACGGISKALSTVKSQRGDSIPVQVEVENLEQLLEALEAGAKLILLDNFSIDDTRRAVEITAGRAELEASGGVTLHQALKIAKTGVDRISIGSLTKDIEATDFSMRFTD